MDTRKAYIKAFIKARKEFSVPNNDRSGQYKYASIGELRNAIDKALEKYGLSYEFHIHESVTEKPDRIELCVEHEDGEQRHSTYPLIMSQTSSRQNEHQSYGSAVSYAMRNLLRSFFALDADDNDPDNRPTLTPQKQPQWKPALPSVPSVKSPDFDKLLDSPGQQSFASNGGGPNYGNPNKTVSDKQVGLINRLIGLTNSDRDEILEKYGVDGIDGLNGQQGSELISDLKKKQDG